MSEASAPYTMPIMESTAMTVTMVWFLAASGSSGREKRRKP